MKNPWIIHCVGTSEEDQAHLRLLLRSARKHVGEDWVWGDESEADLLMIDGHSPIGESAILRASQPGVASAQLIEADEPTPAGRFLRKPFHSGALAELLNDVAHGDSADADTAESGVGAVESGRSDVDAATPEAGHPVAAPTGLPPQDQQNQTPGKVVEPNAEENVMRPLLYYLPKRVLGGPAQISLPDAPVLVIDPDARMFWAHGSLLALEPYVREQLRFGDWKRLDGAELDQAREGIEAKPYAYLTWMDSFIHSKGSLSRRLDPGGTYRLTKRLDLANDYPRALRISAQMTQPRRLDAIARASGAELAEVFDVVNAYEAIGYLEWTRGGAAPKRLI